MLACLSGGGAVGGTEKKKKKTTQGWVFYGVRRHAEPLGDVDPPRLVESAGG